MTSNSSEHKIEKKIGQEYPPEGEQAAIQQLCMMLKSLHKCGPGVWRRGQHPKHQGCLSASFQIEDKIPDQVKVGVFKEKRLFDAFIRFSNGKGDCDNEVDAHGMAIKLMGVDGEKLLGDEKRTQDFILVDHPVFFAKNVEHMNVFASALLDPETSNEEILKTHPILKDFKKPPKASPLESQYWSQTPYLLGECAARYSVVPAQANRSGKDPVDSDNFLQEALIEFLAHREVQFDFCVQLQTDPYDMDIEDLTLPWDESVSPPIKVATIIIPKQKFDSPSQMAFCETLSFNPRHSLPEHRPLGGINRARARAYRESSGERHNKYEPTGEEKKQF